MSDETNERLSKANKTVIYYTSAAVTAAVIPVPIADAVAITGVQLTMGTHITHKIYDTDIGVSTLKVLLSTYAASNIGMWAWSLVKSIPGIGTGAGIAGQMIIAGTITATLGYALIELCEKKIPINKDNLKKAANKNKERGKKTAQDAYEKNKDSAEILKNIAFTQSADLTSDQIDFSFDLEKLENPKLICTHISSSTKHEFELNKSQTTLEVNVRDWADGQYEVKLVDKNIPDVMRYFVKEEADVVIN